MKERKSNFYLGIAFLLLGSFIYILFRPTTLLMFHWFDYFNLTKIINFMRIKVIGFDNVK